MRRELATARRHVARHGVTREEAEQAVLDAFALVRSSRPGPNGESRWRLLGATLSSRVLKLIYTRRGPKLRVVTAYDAPGRERRRYQQIKEADE
jgi:uncharacterized DUF497 family protein